MTAKKATPTLFLFLVIAPSLLMAQIRVPVKDGESLVRVGMNPHPSAAHDSIVAHRLYHDLLNSNTAGLISARDYYKEMNANDSLKEKSYGSLYYILARLSNTLADTNSDILSDDLFKYFTSDSCAKLKRYLLLKYTLNNYKPRSVKEYISERTFYDDMLMFNNPFREQWDHTDAILDKMPIKEGDEVVDIGCAFGYNTLRLSRKVGSSGFVYGTDTEKAYSDHLSAVIDQNGISNVKIVHTTSDNIGIDNSVDLIVMSSLYHIIYTWSREDERKALIHSIQKVLKKGGYLAIIDNNNLHGQELNNCHVDPHLVEAQLHYYGFERYSFSALSPQRYLLVMQYMGERAHSTLPHTTDSNYIEITSGRSIVHIGSLDSYDITEYGIDAARYVSRFLSGGPDSVGRAAVYKYEKLIPTENFGGEYSALQWICNVKLSDDSTRAKMLADPLNYSFYHYLTDDSAAILRYYLLHKYKLGSEQERMLSDSLLEMSGEVGRTHRSYLEDYIIAINPNRPLWEQTDSILKETGIQKGDTIVDIGSGSGYYTYRFSNIVGDSGQVYAYEIKDEHIERLTTFLKENAIKNVTVVKGKEDSFELHHKVDCMFMCSLYHILYGVLSDTDRDAYLRDLLSHLKTGGRLIIVDNSPVSDSKLPYHGPYIEKNLIINQLSHYGLTLKQYNLNSAS